MDTARVTRSYLETLSSHDLLELADDYGIDVPDNLNRRFIIGELLEAVAGAHIVVSDLEDSGESNIQVELPSSYNETRITAVMRNPVWCYVFWDFYQKEYKTITDCDDFLGFCLLFTFYVDKDHDTPVDSFEVPIGINDRDRSVLMQHPGFYAKVELVAKMESKKPNVLSDSEFVLLPGDLPDLGCKMVNQDVSPILKLSGMQEILLSQYVNHRQSFS